MKKKGVIILLISVVVILLIILGYGLYSGIKAKNHVNFLNSEINRLNQENNQLVEEKNNLTSQFDSINKKYGLLVQDVAKIYKTCIDENKCKGHYPGVSWYCNNVGDEVNDSSHICVCDSGCKLNATEI
jgi:cell division protein FtsB